MAERRNYNPLQTYMNRRNMNLLDSDVARIQNGISMLHGLPTPAALPFAAASRANDWSEAAAGAASLPLGFPANSPNRANLLRQHVAGQAGEQPQQVTPMGAAGGAAQGGLAPSNSPNRANLLTQAVAGGLEPPTRNVDVFQGGMMERTAYPSLAGGGYGPGTRAAPVAGAPPANFGSLMATPPATQWAGGQAMSPLEQATMASMRSDPLGASPNSTWMRGGDMSPEQLQMGAATSFDPRTRTLARAETGLNTRAAADRDAQMSVERTRNEAANNRTDAEVAAEIMKTGVTQDFGEAIRIARQGRQGGQTTPLPAGAGQRPPPPQGWRTEPPMVPDAAGTMRPNQAAGWHSPPGFDVTGQIISQITSPQTAQTFLQDRLPMLHGAEPQLIEQNWPAIDRMLRSQIPDLDAWVEGGTSLFGARTGHSAYYQRAADLYRQLRARFSNPSTTPGANQSMPSAPVQAPQRTPVPGIRPDNSFGGGAAF